MEYSDSGFVKDFFVLSAEAQQNDTLRDGCPDRCVYVKSVLHIIIYDLLILTLFMQNWRPRL